MELIPNLPDEIGRECLLRVSYKSHQKIKGVCRSWRRLVTSPWFYQQRRAKGTSEHPIFMIQVLPSEDEGRSKGEGEGEGYPCAHRLERHRSPAYGITVYDPLEGTWQRLPPIPQFLRSIPLFAQCVSVRGKLILIGGWNPSGWQAMKSVFVYDVLAGKWSRGADMPTVRSLFASCVSPQAVVFVAGGHDEEKNAVPTVEAYDLESNEWEILPVMSRGRDECQAVFLDGKLVVISGYQTESQGRFELSGEIFCFDSQSWKVVEEMWGFGESPRSCASAFGGLYFFYKQAILQYNAMENVWVEVMKMPEGVSVSSCAAAWGDKIFVGGDELMCYMVEPDKGKWIAVKKPQDFVGLVQCSSSLEL